MLSSVIKDDQFLEYVIQHDSLPVKDKGTLLKFAARVFGQSSEHVNKASVTKEIDVCDVGMKLITKWKQQFPESSAYDILQAIQTAKFSVSDKDRFVETMIKEYLKECKIIYIDYFNI